MTKKMATVLLVLLCAFTSLVVRGDDSGLISEYGRQVAQEFLRQFPTIFRRTLTETRCTHTHELMRHGMYGIPRLYGRATEDGRFIIDNFEQGARTTHERHFLTGWYHNNPILTTDVPAVYVKEFDWWMDRPWELNGFYDRRGNKIREATWLMDGCYASRLRLVYMGNNGIPDIFIYYYGHDFGGCNDRQFLGAPIQWFRYVNGNFHEVMVVRQNINFYFCDDGSLITRNTFAGCGDWDKRYNRLILDGNEVTFQSIASFWLVDHYPQITYAWSNHITGESGLPLDAAGNWCFCLSTHMGITLTPIAPLTRLQYDITHQLAAHFRAYGTPLLVPHYPPILSGDGFHLAVVATDMRLRAGPGRDTRDLGIFNRDTMVEIMEVLENPNHMWNRVRIHNTQTVGYMYGPLLRPMFSETATAWPAPLSATPLVTNENNQPNNETATDETENDASEELPAEATPAVEPNTATPTPAPAPPPTTAVTNPNDNPTREMPWQIITASAAGIAIASLVVTIVMKRGNKKSPPEAASPSARFCGKCGNPYKPGSKFCNKCGGGL